MHDLRFALRMIGRDWGFSTTVTLILALCIGANTAVLCVVNAAMVQPLAYPRAERLAQVVAIYRGELVDDSHDGTTWEVIRDRASAVDAASFGGGWTGVNMGVNGTGVYVQQQRVSAGFFGVLGIKPEIGREFNDVEDRAGGPAAVVLSNSLWKRFFSGDPSVVGKAILLRGEPYTVVGVMPGGFRSNTDADLWTPLRPSRTGEGSGTNYGVIARLRPGVTWVHASSQLASLVPDLKRLGSYGKDANVRLDIVSLQRGMTGDLRRPLMILWAAVGAVFVLGCVNIAGMLLARSTGRAGEIATRLALGAPIGRIVRQLLAESLVMGLLGGVAGVAVGWAGLQGLKYLGADLFSFLKVVEFDWRMPVVALVLTLLAGMGFGLVPAWQSAHMDLRSAQAGLRTVAGKRRFISLGGLVGGQVALTVPLLVGAGLLLRTFLFLWNLNPGFDTNHLLTARFSMSDARYTASKMNQYYDTVIGRLHEIPGIEAAAVSLNLPYERGLNDGLRLAGDTRFKITDLTYVTPEYFTTMRIPLFQGRVISTADGPDSAKVAVVNQALVDLYFSGRPVIGESVRIEGKQWVIVGVVGNVQQKPGWGAYGPLGQIPAVYIPAAQTSDGFLQVVHTWFSPNWIVRSRLADEQVKAAIGIAAHSADPLVPMAEFRSVNDLKLSSLKSQRFLASLVDVLAGLAILLATLGIYGLISNLVAERTRELGIRLALGSTAGKAVWTALRPGLLWVSGGVLVGTGVALGLERMLRSFTFGVQAADPVTLAGVGAGLILATLLASFFPAARIVRLNPADTLRAE
jgi:predicted permease